MLIRFFDNNGSLKQPFLLVPFTNVSNTKGHVDERFLQTIIVCLKYIQTVSEKKTSLSLPDENWKRGTLSRGNRSLLVTV